MKKAAQKMRVAKCKPKPKNGAIKSAACYCEPSAVWPVAGLVLMASICCGGAMLALSSLSFVPNDLSNRFLAQVYEAYAAPGLAVNRIASGEKIPDENVFGLLQVVSGSSQRGQVAGAVEMK